MLGCGPGQEREARVRLRLLLAAVGLSVLVTVGTQLLLVAGASIANAVQSIITEPLAPGEGYFLGSTTRQPSWRTNSVLIINAAAGIGLLILGFMLWKCRSGLCNLIVRRAIP